MRVHEAVPHGGPVIVPMIQIAGPRLFLVVAGVQRGIKGCDRLLDRGPLPLPVLVLGHACLQTALVFVRSRIADVLVAVGLGKEQPEADAACRFGIGGIEAFGARNGGAEIGNVLEWRIRVLRVGGRRLHQVEKPPVLIEQRLIVGAEIRRRDAVFVGPAYSGRKRVGEILVRAHHVVAGKVERLSRQVGQPLFRIDLRPSLAQDLLELAS